MLREIHLLDPSINTQCISFLNVAVTGQGLVILGVNGSRSTMYTCVKPHVSDSGYYTA